MKPAGSEDAINPDVAYEYCVSELPKKANLKFGAITKKVEDLYGEETKHGLIVALSWLLVFRDAGLLRPLGGDKALHKMTESLRAKRNRQKKAIDRCVDEIKTHLKEDPVDELFKDWLVGIKVKAKWNVDNDYRRQLSQARRTCLSYYSPFRGSKMNRPLNNFVWKATKLLDRPGIQSANARRNLVLRLLKLYEIKNTQGNDYTPRNIERIEKLGQPHPKSAVKSQAPEK